MSEFAATIQLNGRRVNLRACFDTYECEECSRPAQYFVVESGVTGRPLVWPWCGDSHTCGLGG